MSSVRIHAFKSWTNIINSQKHKPNISTAEFLDEPLWYNYLFKIDSKDILYQKLFENAVIFVKHLVNKNGEYQTYNDLKQIYKTNCDFLTYNSLNLTVKSKQSNSVFNNLESCMFPNLPSTVSLFYKKQKGSQIHVQYTHKQTPGDSD